MKRYFFLGFLFFLSSAFDPTKIIFFNDVFNIYDFGQVLSTSELAAFRPSAVCLTPEESAITFLLKSSSNATNLVTLFNNIYGNASTNFTNFSLQTKGFAFPPKILQYKEIST